MRASSWRHPSLQCHLPSPHSTALRPQSSHPNKPASRGCLIPASNCVRSERASACSPSTSSMRASRVIPRTSAGSAMAAQPFRQADTNATRVAQEADGQSRPGLAPLWGSKSAFLCDRQVRANSAPTVVLELKGWRMLDSRGRRSARASIQRGSTKRATQAVRTRAKSPRDQKREAGQRAYVGTERRNATAIRRPQTVLPKLRFKLAGAHVGLSELARADAAAETQGREGTAQARVEAGGRGESRVDGRIRTSGALRSYHWGRPTAMGTHVLVGSLRKLRKVGLVTT